MAAIPVNCNLAASIIIAAKRFPCICVFHLIKSCAVSVVLWLYMCE